jgi:hypothetical protein
MDDVNGFLFERTNMHIFSLKIEASGYAQNAQELNILVNTLKHLPEVFQKQHVVGYDGRVLRWTELKKKLIDLLFAMEDVSTAVLDEEFEDAGGVNIHFNQDFTEAVDNDPAYQDAVTGATEHVDWRSLVLAVLDRLDAALNACVANGSATSGTAFALIEDIRPHVARNRALIGKL